MSSATVAAVEHESNQPLASQFDPMGLRLLEMGLRRQLCGHVRDFQLEPFGQGLILRGRANSYYAKQVAQEAVMEATDLPIEANQIAVG